MDDKSQVHVVSVLPASPEAQSILFIKYNSQGWYLDLKATIKYLKNHQSFTTDFILFSRKQSRADIDATTLKEIQDVVG